MNKFITLVSEGNTYTINTDYIIRIEHDLYDESIIRIVSSGDMNYNLVVNKETLEKLLQMLGAQQLSEYNNFDPTIKAIDI